ncbi:hypothetical protein FA13DRAFT_1815616 [Coprinellus micaceus]|uniref:Uncharacterized protein n=1 Tax=Coprinellus micaceus TaxID=71717 RepID=A0A4Y7T5A3_COPMI|nr:hypothetical protein FA13DRAFT_1815616 [Coprinellus micaceus]
MSTNVTEGDTTAQLESERQRFSPRLGGFDKFKITAWRTINSYVLVSFRITKTIAAYDGNPSVTAWDMALGLIWVFMLVYSTLQREGSENDLGIFLFRSYWCGLLENGRPSVAPCLFDVDITEVALVPAVLVGMSALLFVSIGTAMQSVWMVGTSNSIVAWTVRTLLGFSSLASTIALFHLVKRSSRNLARIIAATASLHSPAISYNDWNLLHHYRSPMWRDMNSSLERKYTLSETTHRLGFGVCLMWSKRVRTASIELSFSMETLPSPSPPSPFKLPSVNTTFDVTDKAYIHNPSGPEETSITM